MRSLFGGAIGGLGCVIIVGWGLVSFIVNFSIVINGLGWGFLGAAIAFMFFPITIVFAPWYALIAWGNPIPLAITYGGGIVGAIVMAIASAISGDD